MLSLSVNTGATLPLIPDEIAIPKNIEKKTAVQIKALFDSLEKQNNNKTANLWKLRYQKALLLEKKDSKAFCTLMKELAQVKIFLLKDLALIKSYSLCSFSEYLVFVPSLVPSWLSLDLAKAFYKRRKFFDKPKETLRATFYLGQNSPYKELRVSYLKHALKLFEENHAKASQSPVKKQGRLTEESPTKAEIQELLYKESPSLALQDSNWLVKKENFLLIAEDFRRRRKFEQARVYYIKVLNLPQFSFEDKNLAFTGLEHIYRVQRNRAKRLKNSNQWSVWLLRENTKQSLKKYYRKKLEIARQKWNKNENQEAISILTDLLKAKKSYLVENEVLLLRGSIHLQENQENLSLQDWDKVIKNLFSKKRQKEILEKALWNKAWIYRKRKDYRKALESFLLLTDSDDNPYSYHRALFWTGQTYEDIGSCFYSRRFFREVAKKDSYGYYGLLASYKLNQNISFGTKALPPLKVKPLVHWLDLFEETEILSRLVEKDIQDNSTDESASLEEWLYVINLWNQSEKYLKVFQSFQKMSPEVQKELIKEHAQVLFPLNFYDEINLAGEKNQLNKALLFSIIRQESAFNTRARSPADAFGLMQLIPSTARQVAKRSKIPYRSYKELYQPSKNIQLGSLYLSQLLKQYDQNFILVVAAYNAGSTPVNRWKKTLGFWTPLEFIENISYQETKVYVRLIIRNYIFYYNLLNNKKGFPKHIKKSFESNSSKC